MADVTCVMKSKFFLTDNDRWKSKTSFEAALAKRAIIGKRVLGVDHIPG